MKRFHAIAIITMLFLYPTSHADVLCESVLHNPEGEAQIKNITEKRNQFLLALVRVQFFFEHATLAANPDANKEQLAKNKVFESVHHLGFTDSLWAPHDTSIEFKQKWDQTKAAALQRFNKVSAELFELEKSRLKYYSTKLDEISQSIDAFAKENKNGKFSFERMSYLDKAISNFLFEHMINEFFLQKLTTNASKFRHAVLASNSSHTYITYFNRALAQHRKPKETPFFQYDDYIPSQLASDIEVDGEYLRMNMIASLYTFDFADPHEAMRTIIADLALKFENLCNNL